MKHVFSDDMILTHSEIHSLSGYHRPDSRHRRISLRYFLLKNYITISRKTRLILVILRKGDFMGLDSNQKVLANYNDVFADIMNVLLYKGKHIIREQNLEDSKDRSQYKAEGLLHEQERDVSKIYKHQQMRIAFLGIENENREEEYMPLRVISYDGASYRSQLLRNDEKKDVTKKQKPYPVVTVVLYFGMKRWSKGKSLYDVLDIPEDLKPFVSDYKINVVEVAYLKPEQVAMFQSDFYYIADFFVQKRTTGKYIPPSGRIIHRDAFLKLLTEMVGDKRYEEIVKEMNENNKNRDDKEGTEMCEVYDYIFNRGVEQERAKTEEAIRRAEEAEKRTKKAEEEVRRLKKLLAEKG